jgi:hypothetical protein
MTAGQRINLTDALNRINSGLGALAGINRAREALAKKDGKFFESIGLRDWKTMSEQEVLDYTGRWVTEGASGSMDFRDLHPFAYKTEGWLGAVAPLARWSMAYTKKQIDRAFKPLAQTGNPMPLIKTIVGGAVANEAYNMLREWLTGQKPRDLTWSEWLKGGAEDKLEYLAVKLAEAQMLPIAATGVLAMTGRQQLPQNTLLSVPTKQIARIRQFIKDADVDKTSMEDWKILADAFAQDTFSIYRDFMKDDKTDVERYEGIYAREFKDKAAAPGAFMNNPFNLQTRLNEAKTKEEVDKIARLIWERADKDTAKPAIKGASKDEQFLSWLAKINPDAARGEVETGLREAQDPASLYNYKKALADQLGEALDVKFGKNKQLDYKKGVIKEVNR